MKASIHKITLLAVYTSLLSATSHAQGPEVPGSVSNLTLKMTASMTVEGTTAKDENGKPLKPAVPSYSNEWTKQDKNNNVVEEGTEESTKQLQVKISNKEILEMLVSEGVIPDISGWSLAMVAPALSPDDEGSDAGPFFYIVKQGATPIYVGDYFEVWDYSSAETYQRRTITKFKYDSGGTMTGSTYSDSGSYASTTAVYTTFSTENGQVRDEALLQINGIWRESGSLVRFGDSASTDYRLVPKSSSLTGISGDLSSYDKQSDSTTSSVIDGTWSAKSTVLNDISADYPEAGASVAP